MKLKWVVFLGFLGFMAFLPASVLQGSEPPAVSGFAGEGLGLYHLGWSPEGRWAGLVSYATPPAIYLIIANTISDEILLRSEQAGWKGNMASFWKARGQIITTEVQSYGIETQQKMDVREAEFLTGGIRYNFIMSPASPANGPYTLELQSRLKGRKLVYNGKKASRAELLGSLVSPFESRALAVLREKSASGALNYRFVGAHLLLGFPALKNHQKEQSGNLVSPVLNGQIEILKLRLAGGADPNQTDSRGFAVIVIAARLGSWEIVQRLQEAGARVDARDADGRTALHYAAFFGQEAVLKALLQNGANADLQDKAGRKPRELAALPSVRALLE